MNRADGYTQETADRYCICVTSGPYAYGPDDACPMHGANPTIRPDDDPPPIPDQGAPDECQACGYPSLRPYEITLSDGDGDLG